MVPPVGILPQSYDYCDTEYFKLIYSNGMEMHVIEWTKPLVNVSPTSCWECLEIWQEGSWRKMLTDTDWREATKILYSES